MTGYVFCCICVVSWRRLFPTGGGKPRQNRHPQKTDPVAKVGLSFLREPISPNWGPPTAKDKPRCSGLGHLPFRLLKNIIIFPCRFSRKSISLLEILQKIKQTFKNPRVLTKWKCQVMEQKSFEEVKSCWGEDDEEAPAESGECSSHLTEGPSKRNLILEMPTGRVYILHFCILIYIYILYIYICIYRCT